MSSGPTALVSEGQGASWHGGMSCTGVFANKLASDVGSDILALLLVAKQQVENPGSAKAAEALGIGALAQWLAEQGLDIRWFVLDGDTGVHDAVREAFRRCIIISCFNHMCKTLCKTLVVYNSLRTLPKGVTPADIAARITAMGIPLAPSDVPTQCICKTSKHKWTGSDACGCPSKSHSEKTQSLVHAAAHAAGADVDQFKATVLGIAGHLRGDHSNCDFHAKQRCNCPMKHPHRVCSCGKCVPDKARSCLGRVVEPPCTGTPYTSKVRDLSSCPFHVVLYQYRLALLFEEAEKLIIPAVGGRVTTNLSEGRNGVVEDFRTKGVNHGPIKYSVATTMGVLRGSERAFRRLKAAQGETDPRQWLWSVRVAAKMGVPYSQGGMRNEVANVERREKEESLREGEAFKVSVTSTYGKKFVCVDHHATHRCLACDLLLGMRRLRGCA